MGWLSKIWKGVKNVFSKVTKVVKKVVKSVGKTAGKIWNKVKGVAKKFAKGVSKLGPLANIAIGFIPGFQGLWAGAGIWGQVAKGAITGYLASGGDAKGALLGAVGGGLGHAWNNMPGKTISEKVGGWFDSWKDTSALSKAGGFHMKGGELIAGKAPLGTQMMGRSSDAYGYAETQLNTNLAGTNYWADRAAANAAGTTFDAKAYDDIFKQVDIDATNYNEGYTSRERAIKDSGTAKQPSLLDKLRDAIPPTWGDTASAQQGYPYAVGDTGPLTSYDTAAGVGQGRGGYGRDPNEELVRSLGLTPLLAQYNQYKQRTGYA